MAGAVLEDCHLERELWLFMSIPSNCNIAVQVFDP